MSPPRVFMRELSLDEGVRLKQVADNLFDPKTPAIREWAATSNVELVFTPTYASFLNRIECHFWSWLSRLDYPNRPARQGDG